MTTLPTAVDKGLRRFAEYDRGVVAWIGSDGYPVNIRVRVQIDDAEADEAKREGAITLSGPALASLPDDVGEATVTVSHIRPQPGIGYDQRRYATASGVLERRGKSVLMRPTKVTGWDEQTVSFFEYCERSVPRARRYMDQLSKELGREVRPRLSPGWRFFAATRIPFLTATILPVMLGAVIARADGYSAWWYVMLALAGAIAVHLGLNVANDVFDTQLGADDANSTPTPFSGGSRVIQYGIVSVRAMRWLALSLFGIGIAIGVVLAALRGWQLLFIGAVGIFLAVAYTAPPLKLVYRGMGDAAVAIGFGPVMVAGSYFVAARTLNREAIYASLPLAILVMLILYVNQVPDRRADAVAGKRTLAVRLSRRAVIGGYDISAVAAFALVALGVMAGWMPPGCLLALPAIPLAIKVHRGLVAGYDSPYELMAPMAINIALHAAVGVALIAGYVIAILH